MRYCVDDNLSYLTSIYLTDQSPHLRYMKFSKWSKFFLPGNRKMTKSIYPVTEALSNLSFI